MGYTLNMLIKTEELSDKFLKLMIECELADYSNVKGSMIYLPYTYSMWEEIQKQLDQRFKKTGVLNVYFPLLIPYSAIEKEKEHLEGFAPELALVTHAGGEKLEDPLVIRPTSETIICDYFSKHIKSWRDLPFKINQWVNVLRWEKRTFPFLRNSEFLWQEGHTVHATYKEADKEALDKLNIYKEILENYLCISGIVGKKSKGERFAGADTTYTFETLMKDGKAVQVCTSHNLSDNFAKVFDIKYQDKNKENKYVYQTSWGISMNRSLGSMFLSLIDNSGLVIPPSIAPYQVVIIPIFNQETEKRVLDFLDILLTKLENIRVYVDNNTDKTPGYKFNYYEKKGIPIRIEIGIKEVNNDEIVLVRRDTLEKKSIKLDKIEISLYLEDIQKNMLNKSKMFLEENTHEVSSFGEFSKVLKDQRGFIFAYFCESEKCEKEIKEQTLATVRCIPFNLDDTIEGKCIYCKNDTKIKAYFAKSY